MTTIHDIMDMLFTDPAGISMKFGIPLRTVYGWCSGSRKPPEYIITMMLNIILLERRLSAYGYIEERLEERMGGNTKGIPEAGEKS